MLEASIENRASVLSAYFLIGIGIISVAALISAAK